MPAESLDTIAQRVAARSLLALEQLLESKNESVVLRAASAALRSIVALGKPRRRISVGPDEAPASASDPRAPAPDIHKLEVYPGLTVSALLDRLAEAEDRADRADAANNCLMAELNNRLPPGVTAAELISAIPKPCH